MSLTHLTSNPLQSFNCKKQAQQKKQHIIPITYPLIAFSGSLIRFTPLRVCHCIGLLGENLQASTQSSIVSMALLLTSKDDGIIVSQHFLFLLNQIIHKSVTNLILSFRFSAFCSIRSNRENMWLHNPALLQTFSTVRVLEKQCHSISSSISQHTYADSQLTPLPFRLLRSGSIPGNALQREMFPDNALQIHS